MDFNTTIAFLTRTEITALTSIITILSFIITLYVALSLARIKKIFKFKARTPQLSNNLDKLASRLNSELNKFSGLNSEVRKILAEVEVTLVSLKKLVKNDLKKTLKDIMVDIENIEPQQGWFSQVKEITIDEYKDKLSKIYISLYKLSKQIDENIEDSKWDQS